jgi:ribosomal protein RSM22 (predicted rRNA methylase)
MQAFNRPPRYRLSPEVQRLLHEEYQEARRTHGDRLPGYIAELSQLFTKNRSEVGQRYLDREELAAGYLAYFFPVNFAKVQVLLDELPDDWPHRPCWSILDVGAGQGAASLACWDWLRRRGHGGTPVHVTALDHSRAALDEAARLWEAYRREAGAGPVQFTTAVQHVQKFAATCEPPAGHPFDLIVMANVLNELSSAGPDPMQLRSLVLERLLSLLPSDGTLLIVEPALRSSARALHETRDLLVARGACTVYSPCLHDRPCPALRKAEDWCHEERAWEPPDWIRQLDREVGFVKDALKFSYLILRKDGRTIVPRRPNVYRVVSELRVLKGEKRAWLCHEDGRSEVGRLDRRATAANAGLDEWHRGAIVAVEQIVRKQKDGKTAELGRVAEDSTVAIVRPA